MLAVAVPTIDGRELRLVRRREASRDVQLLLDRLGLSLPPETTSADQSPTGFVVAIFFGPSRPTDDLPGPRP